MMYAVIFTFVFYVTLIHFHRVFAQMRNKPKIEGQPVMQAHLKMDVKTACLYGCKTWLYHATPIITFARSTIIYMTYPIIRYGCRICDMMQIRNWRTCSAERMAVRRTVLKTASAFQYSVRRTTRFTVVSSTAWSSYDPCRCQTKTVIQVSPIAASLLHLTNFASCFCRSVMNKAIVDIRLTFTSLFFTLVSFSPFPFLVCFTYFLLSVPSLYSTRVVPLRFQAGGRRRRPNLALVCYGRPM